MTAMNVTIIWLVVTWIALGVALWVDCKPRG